MDARIHVARLPDADEKDAVGEALRAAAALAARRRDLQRLVCGHPQDLADEEVMRGAWQ